MSAVAKSEVSLSASAIVQGVAERLKALRLEKDLSVEQVAQHLDLSAEAYLEFESGNDRIDPKYLVVLADLLQVETKSFFKLEK